MERNDWFHYVRSSGPFLAWAITMWIITAWASFPILPLLEFSRYFSVSNGASRAGG